MNKSLGENSAVNEQAIEFWKDAFFLEISDEGYLKFPEDWETLRKYNEVVRKLPKPPVMPVGTRESVGESRELLTKRYICLAISLCLPYMRVLVQNTPSADWNNLSYWKDKYKEMVNFTGDAKLVRDAASQRINLEDTLGKKYQLFQLSGGDLVTLCETLENRKLISQRLQITLNSQEIRDGLPALRKLRINEAEELLESSSSMLYKILNLSIDNLSTSAMFHVSQEFERLSAKDRNLKKKDFYQKKVEAFRMKELTKYRASTDSYKLPVKR